MCEFVIKCNLFQDCRTLLYRVWGGKRYRMWWYKVIEENAVVFQISTYFITTVPAFSCPTSWWISLKTRLAPVWWFDILCERGEESVSQVSVCGCRLRLSTPWQWLAGCCRWSLHSTDSSAPCQPTHCIICACWSHQNSDTGVDWWHVCAICLPCCAVRLWGWMAFASWWLADLLVLRSQMRDVRLDQWNERDVVAGLIALCSQSVHHSSLIHGPMRDLCTHKGIYPSNVCRFVGTCGIPPQMHVCRTYIYAR